jgi:hypothetical protein
LEFVALLTHGLTAKWAGARALSVIDSSRERAMIGANLPPCVRFLTLFI